MRRPSTSRPVPFVVLACVAFAVFISPAAAEDAADLLGRPLPAWSEDATWFNVPWDGLTAPGSVVADQPGALRGRVSYLLLVSPNSRESHTVAMPNAQRLAARYARVEDAQVVVVFVPEGRPATDTPEAVAEIVKRRGLTMPVAWGAWDGAAHPVARVPWALIADRRGVVRYSARAPDVQKAALVMDAVREAGRQRNPLVGKPFGDASTLRMATADGRPLDFSQHDLTLVRWWTTSCPFCVASIPALTDLGTRRRADGLYFLPIYHYKGGPRYDLAGLRAYLKKLGHEGDLAVDLHWKKLKTAMSRAGFTKATSVSFLVDRKGIVRWVHPGPRILYSGDPSFAENDADMRGLETIVDQLLAESRRPAAGAFPQPKPAAPEPGGDGDAVPGR